VKGFDLNLSRNLIVGVIDLIELMKMVKLFF